jgi:hypothetical protein
MSNSVNFHVQNYSHRYQSALEQKTLIKIPSAFSSLCRVMLCLRDQTALDSLSTMNQIGRQQKFFPYQMIGELQCYINNKPYWSEPISGSRMQTELYQHTINSFPAVSESSYYSQKYAHEQYEGTPFIGVSLCAAPVKFSSGLISGEVTKNQVSDMYFSLTWQHLPSNCSATMFLDNDARIYVDSSGCLQIEN